MGTMQPPPILPTTATQRRAGMCSTWWNEIPIVEAQSGRRFLAKTQVLDVKNSRGEWSRMGNESAYPPMHTAVSFSHFIYEGYLLLYEGWTLVDLSGCLAQPVEGEGVSHWIAAKQEAFDVNAPHLSYGYYDRPVGEHGGGNADLMRRLQPHWAYFRSFRDHPEWYAGTNILLTFNHDLGGVYLYSDTGHGV